MEPRPMEPRPMEPRQMEPRVFRPGVRASPQARLTGTLVHRLFERRVPPSSSQAEVAALVLRSIRPEELVDVEDPGAAAAGVAAAYLAFRRRDDVVAWLSSGRVEYEVPFSFRPPDRPTELVRGAIDCVVSGPDGTLTVLEFKTGAPRPDHTAQAAIYAEALRASWPGRNVDFKILYL
jgi:ATP-dependent exoDNAse (exonuclease V) beta subunit